MGEVATTESVTTEENKGDKPKEEVATPPKEEVKKPVSDANLAKALGDIAKHKAKIAELETANEKSRLDKLRESENWQTLASEETKRADTAEAKNKALSDSIQYDKKYSAVKTLAIQAGLRKEAINDLELIDLPEVQLETTSTGRINVLGAEKALERIKMSKPHWFNKRGTVNINPGEPGVVSGGEIKYNELLKAEETARKTGDYAPYESLHKKYLEQTRR